MLLMKERRRRTMPPALAPKAERVQITVTINRKLMESIDEIARESGRNRSEMLDRVCEYYLAHQGKSHL